MGFLEDIRDAAEGFLGGTVGQVGRGIPFLGALTPESGGNEAYQAPFRGREHSLDPRERKRFADWQWYDNYIKRLRDAQIDPITRRELDPLAGGERGGQLPDNLDTSYYDTEFNAAIEGKGKYANRLRNYKSLMLFQDRPGGAQLFSNAATRSQAGAGLLTGDTSGLLSRS